MKDKHNSTDEVRYPKWEHFDAMDTILKLSHRPVTKPPVVVVVESTVVSNTMVR